MESKKENQLPEEENVQAPETQGGETVKEQDERDEKIAALEKELQAEKDKYLRLAAEYDNYRKRTAKEREGLYTDVKCDTILKLLPVYDNLARALKQETADEAYKKGVEMTMTQLEGIFEKLNVKAIPAVGEKFDPNFHNAVMHVNDETKDNGVIVEEFEKGFVMGDKVIRFSMVVVAN